MRSFQGVTSAFKRFFPPYCELQVLFEAAIGAKFFDAKEKLATTKGASSSVVEAEEENRGRSSDASNEAPAAAVWETMRQLADLLLERDVADVSALRSMLRRRPHGSRENYGGGGGEDAALLQIAIRRAHPGTVVLPAPAISAENTMTGATRQVRTTPSFAPLLRIA